MLVTRTQQSQADQLKVGAMFRLAPGGKTMRYLGNQKYRPVNGGAVEALEKPWSWVFEVLQFPNKWQHDGYDAITQKAEEIGWPEAWMDDLLIHDRISLINSGAEVFGWSVRETGTHLMLPNSTYAVFLTHWLEGEGNLASQEYWWNGRTLKRTPAKRIREKLGKASVPKLRDFSMLGYMVSSQETLSEVQKEVDQQASVRQRRSVECA